MKRVFTLSITLVFLMSLLVSAAPSDIIGEQTGINPDEIPQSTEEIREIYLQQNWEEIITKNAVLSRIHLFFEKISPAFQILFGQPYSLSVRLFFVILLWIYLVSKIDSALYASGMLNRVAQIAISVGTGIILAQLKVLAFLVGSVADLIFKPENWIMRIVVAVMSVAVLLVAHFIIQISIKTIKQSKLKNKDISRDDFIDQAKEFMKGVKTGQDITEKY